MNETLVTVLGRVGTPPRSAVTKGGHAVTSFRLASTPRRFDRRQNDWVDQPTNWFTVTCWRRLADHVTSCVGMGDPVVVHGRLRVSTFTKGDGSAGMSLEIDAVTVGHDLTRGTSMFVRRDQDADRKEADTTVEDLARTVAAEAEVIVAEAAGAGPGSAGSAAA